MSSIEFKRYPNVIGSILAGAHTPYPHVLQRIADVDIPCTRRLVSPERIINEVATVALEFPDSVFVPYRAGIGLTRSDILVYFSSFTDSHRLPIHDAFSDISGESSAIIKAIEEDKERNLKPLSLPEQLSMALHHTSGDITKAVLALAVGTRLMARAYDLRIADDFTVSKRRQFNWKHCVAPLSVIGSTNDPAGDTYHYWHGVLAGLSSSEPESPNVIGRSKNSLCGVLYNQVAGATQLLRYGLSSRSGRIHAVADRLGFETGTKMYDLYASK